MRGHGERGCNHRQWGWPVNPRPRKAKWLARFPSSAVLVRLRSESIYLTFDDGPDPVHTPPLLDLLRKHGVTATFFVVGKNAERHPEIVQRMVNEGHCLGNHSWNHEAFDTLPVADQLDEIARTDALLERFDGKKRHDFRPPCGKLPPSLLFALLRKRIRIAYWSYDSLDYMKLGADRLCALFSRQPLVGGDVVLMHDDEDDAAAALVNAIPAWQAKGMTFSALPAIAGTRP